MIEQIISHVLNLVLGGVISYLFALYKQKKKEMQDAEAAHVRETKALKEGLQSLLRDRIIQAYNHYVKDKGWIPIYAKESINACYKSYEKLGENGVINDLMEQLNGLPNYNDEGGE